MKKNMGTVDKVIRLTVVAIIVILYLSGQITGVAAIILGIVAVAFLVTSLIGWCPTYVPFGISTKKSEKTLRYRPRNSPGSCATAPDIRIKRHERPCRAIRPVCCRNRHRRAGRHRPGRRSSRLVAPQGQACRPDRGDGRQPPARG